MNLFNGVGGVKQQWDTLRAMGKTIGALEPTKVPCIGGGVEDAFKLRVLVTLGPEAPPTAGLGELAITPEQYALGGAVPSSQLTDITNRLSEAVDVIGSVNYAQAWLHVPCRLRWA